MLATNFSYKSLAFFACLLTLFLTMSPSFLQADTGNIAGQVNDAFSSGPVSNAAITVLQNNVIIATTSSDFNGEYTIPNLNAGAYTVTATATNFQMGLIGVVVQANLTTPGDFVLQPQPGNLTGHILDGTTIAPISGATIDVFQGSILIATTTSNGSGVYTFLGLAEGSYTVSTHATHYSTVVLGASIIPNQTTTLNFFLPVASGSVGGTVVSDITSAPIAGALVTLFQGSVTVNFGITDSNGNYLISGIPPGNFTVQAIATTFQTAVQGANVQADLTTVVNFGLLQQPSSIAGQVSNIATGFPVPGATIKAFQNNVLIATEVTGNNGTYTMPSLVPGNYIVTAQITNYQISTQAATVLFNVTTPVDFLLTAQPGTLVGHVSNAADSTAIPGATIDILSGSIIIATGITDSSGNYTILSLPPGNYVARATATNFQTATQGITILSNQTSTANFALQPLPGTISGQVINAVTSAPIPGAVVNVTQGVVLIASAVTDANGHYSVNTIATGTYVATASANHFTTSALGAIVQSNTTTTVNFALEQNPGQISGHVLDAETSNPIAGASVNIFQGVQLIASTLTDALGNYLVSNLAPGSYIANASATNYQTAVEGVAVFSDQTTTANFALSPMPGQLVGQVTDSVTTAPITGATINVTQGLVLIASTVTDSNGHYAINTLAPGAYVATASANLYSTSSQGAIIFSNATTTDNFVLQQDPGQVSGTVIDANTSAPIAGATVNILQGAHLIASTLTDSSGNYLIPNLAPGSYIMNACATNYQTVVEGTTIFATQTSTANFALPPLPGQLIGQVTNASTSAPIAGATVNVTQGLILIASTASDSNGNYAISTLAPGVYTVTASANLFASSTQGATILSHATTTDNFALHQNPGQISGHVIDADSLTPIPGATLNVLQGVQLIASTLTDSSGNYLIPNLAPGTYTVNASATNYQTGSQGAVVYSNQTTVDNFALLLQPGAIIGQVVTQLATTPIPGAIVNVLQGTTLISSSVTGLSGDYSVSSLAPGSYIVSAAATSYQIVVQSTSVPSNQTVVVNFALPDTTGSVFGRVLDIETNLPIPGATLSVFDGSILIASTLTDSSGNYSIFSLPPGTYAVTASATSYITVIKPVTILLNQASELNFLLLDPPLPAASLTGENLCISFLTQRNLVQRLVWTASPSPNIVQYRIYQNGILVGSINPNQPFIFDFHNISANISITYSVTALNLFGEESAPISIVLTW